MIYFWNFGTPFIFWERFELETSNLACRLTTGGTNDTNEKLGQRVSARGHVTYFCNIGSQILYIFETHGIGQTPSSLERYLVCITFKVLHNSALRHLGPLVADLPGRRTLRIATTSRPVAPPIKLPTVGSRVFPVAAAQVWNGLSEAVVSSSSLQTFRRQLKTDLFSNVHNFILT